MAARSEVTEQEKGYGLRVIARFSKLWLLLLFKSTPAHLTNSRSNYDIASAVISKVLATTFLLFSSSTRPQRARVPRYLVHLAAYSLACYESRWRGKSEEYGSFHHSPPSLLVSKNVIL